MMLAPQDGSGPFGRSDTSSTERYLSLQELEPVQTPTYTARKPARNSKLRNVPSLVSAYRPLSGSGTTRHKKSLRPKQEPVSPVMSGYGYSSGGGQGNYNYATSTYQTAVPQYTQTQVNQYYAQYQCYPPQPYQIIPDYYAQPVHSATAGYHAPVATGDYEGAQWHGQSDNHDVNMGSPHGPTRSNSRTKTWTCEISGCTSSANFTRLADLQRHQSTVHGMGTPEFPCTVAHCNRVGDKGFTRRDHLVEHLRNFHHMDIPKRRPGERSAFPFGWPEGFQNQRGGVRKSSRRGGRGASGGSRNTGTSMRQIDTSSALQPSAVVLDHLGMHFSQPEEQPFALGDFADTPRRDTQGEGSGVSTEAPADDDPWTFV
ncbi:hypothetical protein HBH98_002690 [Parastagonospora nodorum]|nr:hypothetical protein HBH51_106460 [Parastagonospora nodorum]KAH4047618.1 hypothetical protein HBH49_167500 [Parastagonospora nodorum]KAH4063752.1 hypothetical protein HBH50_186080 [Parastagonospora nodorum]KAH4079741.1 hypothetical protein HBH48_218120 [Parastagonospora nodorum]KAH4086546.1 hypothetical protein HBH46_203790 [Parastagonospora nodorum]